jgi:hypothetical protein
MGGVGSYGGLKGLLWVRPRRSQCAGCGVTQVLLPVVALLRRADAAVVIGAALAAKAEGSGYRRIAAALGRPEETVWGWLRRFAGRVEAVRVVLACGVGLRSGDARAGRVGVGGRGHRDHCGCGGGGHSVRDRRGGAVGCGGVGVGWAVAGAGMAAGVDQHELPLTRRRSCRDPLRLSICDQARRADGGQTRRGGPG